MRTLRAPGRQNKAKRKEAFYVLVPQPDGTTAAHNITDRVGKPMPYAKPAAVASVRVLNDAVAFSILVHTKNSMKKASGEPILFPETVLSRLTKRARSLGELAPGKAVIDLHLTPSQLPDADEPEADEKIDFGAIEAGVPAPAGKSPRETAANHTYELEISRDDAGVASLSTVGGAPDDEIVQGFAGVRCSVFFRSEVVGRTVGVAFTGHTGRPGSLTTARHCAAMCLSSMTRLVDFRLITGIEAVDVPPQPRTAAPVGTSRVTYKAQVVVPSTLFHPDAADGGDTHPIAAGKVLVDVDLENANPTTNRLLVHITAEDDLDPHFGPYVEAYRAFVEAHIASEIGADLVRAMCIDIVIGEVSADHAQALRDALGKLSVGVAAVPTEVVLHPN